MSDKGGTVPPMVQGPVEVFLAYDAKDEALAAKLEVHLASLMRTDQVCLRSDRPQ